MVVLAAAVFLLAVVEPTAAPAPAGGASCRVPARLPDVTEPWIQIAPDPSADPTLPGYAVVVEFALKPEGVAGRGLFVRLSAPDEDQLPRSERRAWAVIARIPETGAFAIVYADRDGSRDLWTYAPRERRTPRIGMPPPEPRDALHHVCETIQAAAFAPGVELMAATVGRITAAQVRQALEMRLNRR